MLLVIKYNHRLFDVIQVGVDVVLLLLREFVRALKENREVG